MTEERRLVTVLFADVTGSTALGESLDPEELRGLMGRYFAIAREVVESHGGTVEKFIGDAVMAVFGLPVAHGDDVARALDSALELRDRVRDDPALGERLPIRLGVNSGEVVASRDATAGDFLMTGDAVNVAARLQQSAEPWSIVVGERTVRAAPDSFAFRSLDGIAAKGKAVAVDASELLGRREPRHVDRAPLVGRDADLAQLELVAGRAFRERRPFLVSVIAAPGVGKTRLLEEFLDRLEANDPSVAVAVAQCLPYGQRLTYWPMRALLFDLLELSPMPQPETTPGGDPALAGRGRGRVRRTDRRAARGDDRRGGAGARRSRRPVLGLASDDRLAAARRPLVLVIEDLHWSSDSLLDLVEFILQPRGDVALLMVALARPELLDRRPGWGGGRRNFVSLALEPLADSEVATLVADLLEDPVPELVRASSPGPTATRSTPARSSDRSSSASRTCATSARCDACLASLPDTVQATVLARLDVLPPTSRRLLQLGSVFGRSFRVPGIRALEPDLAVGADGATDELLDRDLIRPAGRDGYTFRHILIREVAYGTLTRAERIRLHEEAGAWLEATGRRRRGRDGRADRLPLPRGDLARPADRTADRRRGATPGGRLARSGRRRGGGRRGDARSGPASSRRDRPGRPGPAARAPPPPGRDPDGRRRGHRGLRPRLRARPRTGSIGGLPAARPGAPAERDDPLVRVGRPPAVIRGARAAVRGGTQR